jgi:hypothetical protein
MSDTIITIVVIAGIFVGLPVGILIVKDWLQRPSPEKLAEHTRRFTERLLHPDLPAIEKHFGGPLPRTIHDLYANTAELQRGDFEVAATATADEEDRWFIAFYQPADAESLRESWPGTESLFAFASDGAGNEYVIDPRGSDPSVRFHDHETGEFTPVCDRLSTFMNWPRLEVSE